MAQAQKLTPEQKASRLLELHRGSSPLILINAWDAASAAIIEHCGLPAIATSSAALANALGYADGQNLPWPEMLQAVAGICRTVQVPVTADIEAGFAPDLKGLQTSIKQIIAAGAVGVNLEDALPGHEHFGPLYPLAEQVERIQTARRAGETQGIHLVINARVDAYWQSGVSPEDALRNTLERGKAYLEAGADCIFVPGLRKPDHIQTVIDSLRGVPQAALNILAGPGVPSIPELAKLGVKRVSYGSGPHRAAMGLLRRIADEAKSSGTYTALTEGAVPYAEINGLFGK
ncbi:MAG TPA: isocitrate lyase/phosphoenolpyruvate mutase family protein [Verrucomicrobiae bacterium]|nr:isocitrate lyase/phosphoenolpyruvate mutase family protein [Verrucomicrobiae bacterium]